MDEHQLQGDVARTLADRMLREAGTAVLGHSVLLGIVITLVWGALPPAAIAAWAAAVLAATFARLLLWRRARTLRLAPTPALATVRTTMIALGLAWSVGTAAAVRYLPLVTIVLILMGLSGLLAGAVASLSADRWVFKWFLGSLLGPALITILVEVHEPPETAILALILVFAAFMWREHERAYRTLLEGVRTEQRLRDRERQLAAAQAIAHVGSWEWHIPANRVTWSDELYRMYGVSPATPASYEGFQERVHADDRERVARIIARGLSDRVPVDYEWRLVRADGETRHMLGRNITLMDDQGVAVGLAGTTLDVTERKRAEEAVGKSEAYHRALIEQALDIITIIDADAVLRYLSPSVERVLGYSQTELVGQRAFEFMHPDDLEATLAAFTEGIATPGVLRRLEYRFRHKDGSWRYLEGVGRNLLGDPLINAVVVNARDVSERKAAEENQLTLLHELQTALSQVKTLQGWIRICANCKRVLNDAGVWEQFESYVHTHAGVDFSHGICPACAESWSAAAPGGSR